MTLALEVLGLLYGASLLIWLPPFWKARKYLACVFIVGLSLSAGMIFGLRPSLWSALLLIFSVYQLINLLRLVENRSASKHLYRTTLITTVWLIAAQLFVLLAAYGNTLTAASPRLWWYSIAGAQFIGACVLFFSTRRNLARTKLQPVAASIPDRDLPSISVLIPARNETADLEECLNTLTASTYPKLEIIVLDDCSQTKRTPEIIKSFAQRGVRFIDGEAPSERWVAKNFAYEQLANASNGELLLFCGVDTRFKPETITEIATLMIHKNKQMMSIMPANVPPAARSIEELLVQPGRYAWELTLPRRQFDRPPVLSTCWVISASLLKKSGSFKAVSNSISPESYFARSAISHADGYSFMASNRQMGLHSKKSFHEQKATAIRTRYPQVHKRPELVAAFSLLEAFVLIGPFTSFVVGLGQSDLLLALISGVSVTLLSRTFYVIVRRTYRHSIRRALVLAPFAALYDIGLLNYSMWQYEFREVIWKSRNICVPALQTIKQLPKLP